ncbi:MAG: HlyD family efflux transporter periplasmic adaptor subunit [Cyanobacteriota bacterium]|nr:HlyD family efflux transporter periplasmic adaptor subunit [Cyanobacteriota bacterium]
MSVKSLESPQYKRGIRWLVGSALLAVVSTGGWIIYSRSGNSTSQGLEVQILEVERGTIEETINESGTVELGNQQILKAPRDSTVDEVAVEVGDRVSAGETLVILRDPEQETKESQHLLEIQQAQLDLEAKRNALASAKEEVGVALAELDRISTQPDADLSPLQIQQLDIQEREINLENLRAKVAEARENLETELEILTEEQNLLDEGFTTPNDLRGQERAVRNARSQLRDAQVSVETALLELQRLKAGISEVEEDIAEENERLQTQIQEAENAARNARSQQQQAQAEVDRAENALEQLQLATQQIERELEQSIVAAPTAGQILDAIVTRGDVVQIEAELLVLGDPSIEIVTLSLSTLDANRVESGLPARVSIIGPDDTTFPGRVMQMSLRAAESSSQSNSRWGGDTSQPKVGAIVQLDAPSQTLIPGSPVNVEIILEQRENVVVLGNEAIQNLETDPFVWLVDEANRVSQQPIQVGLEDLTQVEVTSGVKPGDRVAVPPIDMPLEPGMSVTVGEGEAL